MAPKTTLGKQLGTYKRARIIEGVEIAIMTIKAAGVTVTRY